MKKNLLMISGLFVNSMLCLSQDVPPAPEGKAVVYFVRTSSLGFAINFTYFDSATVIAKTNGTNYVRYECDPGFHIFWARSENKDFVDAYLDSGKVYFVEAIPQFGAIKAELKLQPVDPSDKKAMTRIFKLMNKKAPETITPEQVQQQTAEFKDVIELGLEKYRKAKERGSKIERLEKSAFYTL